MQSPAAKQPVSFNLVEAYAAPALHECDMADRLYPQHEADLDRGCYDAAFAPALGEPLATALARVAGVNALGEPGEHPAAEKVRQALAAPPPFARFAERAELCEPVFARHYALTGKKDLPFPPLAAAVHELVMDPAATPWLPQDEPEWDELRGELLRLHARVRGGFGWALSA